MSQVKATSHPTSRPNLGQPGIDFRVLGPLAVLTAGKPIALGGPKQRLVLALLILEANRVVSADRLIDQLWGDKPPDAARGTLQAYISRLRKALGPGRIEAQTPGYRLRAASDELDADRFERLVADAHSRLESDPQAARSLLDMALNLWHGPPLDGLADEPALRAHVARLEEMRLAATEYRVEARLALGHHAELVPELERLVAEHPLRETFSAALMLSLYRSQRQAESLATFERLRQLVSDELGSDPSPGVRRLHERILQQDPGLVPKGGRRLRGYELIERIGEGPNGVVYRAIQPTVNRDVAVKVIHRELANQPEFVRRFEQEAQLVARLEHPHIVPLHDYWREPDGAYVAMRYMRAGNLKERLEAKGPLTVDEAVRLVDHVAAALAAAHRQGVVHRDVRPANVLFDEEGNAYLSDFGIAIEAAVASAMSRRYGALAYYLAPEEIRGEPTSAATDVYGLGLVLYEALAGRHAFGDSPSSEILERLLTAATPRLDTTRPDLPRAVGDVIGRATEKDPAARYSDASSLAAAFRAAVEGGAVTAALAIAVDRNPYKGLRPFDEADASDFFGREQLTAQLIARLKEPRGQSRFLAVVGPSGSGKSSAVRAGLIPAARRGALPGSEGWFVVEMHPGAEPFRELESALLRVAVRHPPSLLEELERDRRGLLHAVGKILPPDRSELLLLIDQFEELFTHVGDEDRRNAFMETLVGAVEDPGSRVRIVITLRADFYDRPLLHPAFGELLAARSHAIAPMRSEEIERAIGGPAEAAGVAFERGLLAAIVSDVTGQPGSLPLLQYALTELFDQRTTSTLTLGAYRRIGGISGALSGRAENVYRHLDEAARAAARQVFLRLVSLGDEGVDASRRRVLRSELAALDVEQPAIDRAIGEFGSHRFLTFDRDSVTRGPTVEVAHEALLRCWGRLRAWIDSSREDLRTYRRFSLAAAEWRAAGREPSFLLRGSRLVQFEQWESGTDIKLSALEREYLDASLSARDADHAEERLRQQREVSLKRRSVNRLRALVAALTVGVLVAGSLALVAQERGIRAGQQARIAAARELAAAAVANLRIDTEQSLLLALQAVQTTRSIDGTVLPEAEEALHAALQAHRLLLTFPGYRAMFSSDGTRLLIVGSDPGQADVRAAATGSLIVSHTAPGRDQARFTSTEVVFSPDGTRFATTSDGDHVAVYDTTSGKQLWRWGSCCGVSFITSDNRYLVTADDTATYLFDLETGKKVNTFPPTRGWWSFSPDGERAIVTDGEWNSDLGTYVTAYVGELHKPGGGTHVLRLVGQGDVSGAAWSPDGSSVATSSPNSVIMWDSRTGRPRFTVSPPTARFTTLAFGTDRELMATGMSDGAAIVWKLTINGAVPVLRLAGHDSEAMSVAFSPDGTRLVTGSADGKVKVWDVTAEGGGESLTVAGSGGLEFSRDGQLIAAGGNDGHARIYDSITGKQTLDLAAHTKKVDAVAFGPRGSTLLTAGSDAIIMSGVDGRVVWTLPPSQADPATVAMSPDGNLVAIPVGDGTVSIVDADTGIKIRALPRASDELAPESAGRAIAFSWDGRFVAVGGGYPYVYVWSVGGVLKLQLSHPNLAALVFSPDDRRLVTVGRAEGIGGVRVYDTQLGHMVGQLKLRSEVTGVAFSPDGSRIATTSTDGTLRLWDATTLEQRIILSTDADRKLVFSPDGTRLAYAAQDHVIRVLALRVDTLVQLARSRLGRSLTNEECRRYLHFDACPPSTARG